MDTDTLESYPKIWDSMQLCIVVPSEARMSVQRSWIDRGRRERGAEARRRC